MRRRRGQGERPPPPLKFGKWIFSSNFYVKFGHFSGNNHVKLGNLANFSGKYDKNSNIVIICLTRNMQNSGILLIFHTYFSGKNVAPLKLTELLCLWKWLLEVHVSSCFVCSTLAAPLYTDNRAVITRSDTIMTITNITQQTCNGFKVSYRYMITYDMRNIATGDQINTRYASLLYKNDRQHCQEDRRISPMQKVGWRRTEYKT